MRRQVTDVWVQGKQLLRARELTTIDAAASKAAVVAWAEKVAAT